MNETPDSLRWLQHIIDRSAATAGSAIKRNFIGGGWSMSAEEFVASWGEERMASISTASASGAVHVAPLDARLVDGRFYIATFPDSQRLRDHRVKRRCGIAAWDGPYHAAIVYGTAREVEVDHAGRTDEVTVEQGYERGALVTVEVTPTRIYAIRPPPGHPSNPRSA